MENLLPVMESMPDPGPVVNQGAKTIPKGDGEAARGGETGDFLAALQALTFEGKPQETPEDEGPGVVVAALFGSMDTENGEEVPAPEVEEAAGDPVSAPGTVPVDLRENPVRLFEGTQGSAEKIPAVSVGGDAGAAAQGDSGTAAAGKAVAARQVAGDGALPGEAAPPVEKDKGVEGQVADSNPTRIDLYEKATSPAFAGSDGSKTANRPENGAAVAGADSDSVRQEASVEEDADVIPKSVAAMSEDPAGDEGTGDARNGGPGRGLVAGGKEMVSDSGNGRGNAVSDNTRGPDGPVLPNEAAGGKGAQIVQNTGESQAQSRADSADLMSQIVERAAVSLKRGQAEMKVILKPEFLGQVRMQVLTENRHVTVKIVAESHMVKEAIEANLGQLKTDLSNQGLEVDAFDVHTTSNSQKDGQNPRYFRMMKPNSGPDGQPSREGEELRAKPEKNPGRGDGHTGTIDTFA